MIKITSSAEDNKTKCSTLCVLFFYDYKSSKSDVVTNKGNSNIRYREKWRQFQGPLLKMQQFPVKPFIYSMSKVVSNKGRA